MTISIYAAAIFLASAPVDGSADAATASAARPDCVASSANRARGFHKRPAGLKALERSDAACTSSETRLADLDVRVFHKKPAALRFEALES